MPRVTCAFCGLPFSVGRVEPGASYYCCSGCALASKIPFGTEGLPVSRELIIALALGFGLFNQALFGALGAAVAAEGRIDVGAKLAIVSVVVGAALFVACIGFVATANLRRWTDAAAAALAVGAAGFAAWRAWYFGVAAVVWPLAVANVWLALWLSRGWVRRAIARSQRPESVK